MPSPSADGLVKRIMVVLNEELNLVLPETNDSNIEALDASLKITEELALVVSDRFMAHHTRVRRQRNAFLPITRLPEEVLTLIFEMAMNFDQDKEENGKTYCERRAVLAAVSFSWRRCIDQTPALWTTLSVDSPIQIIKTALEKSRRYPLGVFACDEMGDRNFDELWTIISPHFDRCRQIEAFTCEILSELIRRGGAGLEDLDIVGDQDSLCCFPYAEGYHPLPRIKRLVLCDVSFPWRSLPLPYLTNLSLHIVTDLPLSCLLGMLENSPLLVKLDLGYMEASDHSVELEKPHSIPLVRLKELSPHGVDLQVACCILSAIQPPTLHRLLIMPVAPSLDYLPSYVMASAEKAISNTGYLEITLQKPGWFAIRSEPSGRCNIGGMDVVGLERWLDHLWGSSSVVPLRLIITNHNDSVPEIGMARSLQSIVEVTVPVSLIPQFFHVICNPERNGSWILPNLSVITFQGEICKVLDVVILSPLFKKRHTSPSISRLTSLTYDNDISDTFTLWWLAVLATGSPQCKIYRNDRGNIFEETYLASLTLQ